MSNLALKLPQGAPFADDEREALGTILGRANPEQRAWLAGYLAGVGSREANRDQPAVPPKTAEPLLILYATESGNSEALANKLASSAKRRGFRPRLVDMADMTPAEAASAKNIVVLASTWGEGDPPQRAQAFYTGLLADGAPRFEGARFSVLSLGDSAYVNFCEVGRRIDERLEALGAKRVADRVDCDLDFAGPAAAWSEGVLEALAPKEERPAGEVIRVAFGERAADPAPWSRERPFAAEVLERVNLNSSRSSKETWHLELSLEGSGLAYQPGDALSIIPENDPATVEAVLKAAGLPADEPLARRLTTDLDITTLSRPVLEGYARLRPHAELASLLEGDAWKGWLQGRQLIDLLEAFPSGLDPAELTGLLRPLAARAYSIASSPLAFPDEAHLLIGLVGFESHGRRREGVASSHVAHRLERGGKVGVFLRPNRHFRLPTDGSTDVVMIGPGTGVAPFRAFTQHRRETGARGRNWLLFGERNFTHDFLYQLEWQEALQDGTLTRMDLAFSRDQPEKIYVQDRLWERRSQLWQWLDGGAHLYLCGDATTMAKDVETTLRRIAVEVGGIKPEAAEAWQVDLVRAGRFQRDVY